MNPSECSAFLADYGWERARGEFGPASNLLGPQLYSIYQAAIADPDAFYYELSRCAAANGGGWAWLGASRVATEVGLEGMSKDPHYIAIAQRTFDFLRSRNISRMHLTGYENEIWYSTNDGDDRWLTPLPFYSENPTVTDLNEGEEREIARLDGLGNRLRVRRVDGKYIVTMHRIKSDTDPTLVEDDQPASVSDSIVEAYRATADGLGSPQAWSDPELEPFFRYGRPDFSR